MEAPKKSITFAKKNYVMEQMARINPAQYEVLNMLSCLNNEEDVIADLSEIHISVVPAEFEPHGSKRKTLRRKAAVKRP